jgi:hypothetical protein
MNISLEISRRKFPRDLRPCHHPVCHSRAAVTMQARPSERLPAIRIHGDEP